MVRHLLIFNPVAGKGRAAGMLATVLEKLDQLDLQIDLTVTEYPGHAIKAAQEAVDRGFTSVIAAGGDGTCNEVINGLLTVSENHRPRMGILPIGRGNDFAYGVGLPGQWVDACKVIAANQTVKHDVGLIKGGDYPEGRYFGNGVGIGFDTIVGLEAAKMQRIHGFLAYVAGALKTLLIYPEAPQINIQSDDDEVTLYTQQISIMNGVRMGGTFFMAPHADPGDGKLDLCTLKRKVGRGTLMRLIGHYIKGPQSGHRDIQTGQSAGYRLAAQKGAMVCHADGETICTNGENLEISCLPQALEIYRAVTL